eukprot:Skav228955  [mRNA]  locus=scaffold3820:99025:99498:- [translate_table: standard]
MQRVVACLEGMLHVRLAQLQAMTPLASPRRQLCSTLLCNRGGPRFVAAAASRVQPCPALWPAVAWRCQGAGVPWNGWGGFSGRANGRAESPITPGVGLRHGNANLQRLKPGSGQPCPAVSSLMACCGMALPRCWRAVERAERSRLRRSQAPPLPWLA